MRRRYLLVSITSAAPDGLAALAGAGAARQHRHVQIARDGDGGGDVPRRAGTKTPTGMIW